LLTLLAPAAHAQAGPGIEASGGAVAAFARHEFWGAVLAVGLRSARRERLVIGGALGTAAGARAGRAEVAVQLLLNPSARTGVTVYGGIGATYAVRRGARGAGYLLLVVGVERGAASSPGWYLEAGLGGGVRLAAGVRIRRLRRR
jgi:hypothetical protein